MTETSSIEFAQRYKQISQEKVANLQVEYVYQVLDTKRNTILQALHFHTKTKMDLNAIQQVAQTTCHKNLVQILDVFSLTDVGTICVTQQPVNGMALTTWIEQQRVQQIKISEYQIAKIVQQVASAMRYLHAKKSGHPLLTAHNIWLDERMHVLIRMLFEIVSSMLIDEYYDSIDFTFGASKKLDGAHHYVAPEVFAQKNNGITSNMWTLGIASYELAMGHAPYAHLKYMQVPFTVATNPSPQLPNPNKWSVHFAHFVSRCLEKNIAQRCTMEQVLQHPFLVLTLAETLFYHPARVNGKFNNCFADVIVTSMESLEKL